MPTNSPAVEPASYFVLLLSFGIFVSVLSGCLTLWGRGLFRLAMGSAILPLEERGRNRPSLGDIILAIGLFGLVAGVLGPIMIPPPADQSSGEVVSLSEVEEATEDTAPAQIADLKSEQSKADTPVLTLDLERMIPAITVQSLATVISTTLVLLWIALRYSSLKGTGFEVRFRDLKLGAAGIFMLLPPIFVIQAILVSFVEYEHPLLDVLKTPQSFAVLAIMAISSSLVAPITEEFFFRGLLQGYLEKIGSRSPALNEAQSLSVALTTSPASGLAADHAETTTTFQPYSPVVPESGQLQQAASLQVPRWPMIISSLAFAAAHAGQGPAPITLFFLALGLGYLYRQTGRIWAGVVVHMFLNGLTTIVTIFGTTT